MKKNRSLSLDSSSDRIIPPAYPTPGYVVFEKFRTLLAAREQKPSVTFHRLMKMVGLPLGTCYGWFATDDLPPVQALLCLMERMPEEDWRNALRPFLRDFPSLQHPRLKHNPETVRMLEKLLSVRVGLTLIRGGTHEDRTFVLTALGHSFSRLDRLHRLPAGMDVHSPKTFVPIESVTYFKETVPSSRLNHLLQETWRKIQRSHAPLLLFNGVLSTGGLFSSQISRLARQRHIVVTDPTMTKYNLARRRMRMAVRSLELSAGQGDLIKIRLVSQNNHS
jgi:hypothetical protein